MLVLDFDNGKLSPEQFEDIFWRKAGKGLKRSFIICNSFSRSPGEPNRFRVIFPFKKPARSINEHKAVLNSIVSRLESEGFSEEDMGLDRQCKSGVQSFYLPCTNRAHPDYAFFRTHGMKTRDIERHGIEPSTYWKTAKPEKTRTRRCFTGEIPSELSPELAKQKSTLMAMTGTIRCSNSLLGWLSISRVTGRWLKRTSTTWLGQINYKKRKWTIF